MTGEGVPAPAGLPMDVRLNQRAGTEFAGANSVPASKIDKHARAQAPYPNGLRPSSPEPHPKLAPTAGAEGPVPGGARTSRPEGSQSALPSPDATIQPEAFAAVRPEPGVRADGTTEENIA